MTNNKDLMNVITELLNVPEEDISKWFAKAYSKKEEKPKVSNTTNLSCESNVLNEMKKTLDKIQETLKENAQQRHALELQLNAINKRVDALAKKTESSESAVLQDICSFLEAMETDLEEEQKEISKKEYFTVEDSIKKYRYEVQLELIKDILRFIYSE